MKKIKLNSFFVKLLFVSMFLNIGCRSNDDANPEDSVDGGAGRTEEVTPPQAAGTTYYVDASIATPGDGKTEATAFKTLTAAASLNLLPGDVVLVKNGTYGSFAETTSGKEGAYIIWRNFPGHNPVVSFNSWQGIYIRGSYVEIDGFTVTGDNQNITPDQALRQPRSCANPTGVIDGRFNGNGIYVDSRVGTLNPTGEKFHHIRIKNCIVSQCGGGGIATIQADYITIEGCRVFRNALYSVFGNSGISFYQHYNSDENTGIKNIIRNNIVYDNEMLVPWRDGGCKFTDGNGIIIDDFKNTQNGSVLGAYKGRTLIENNLVYNNGGRGIHSFVSDNISVINNTCYQNCRTADIKEGEITIIGKLNNKAANCEVYNNIMFARTGSRVNTARDIVNYSQRKNLYINSTLGYNLDFKDKLGNPNFVDVTKFDFRLLPTSFAIDYGEKSGYYPFRDLDKNVRFKGKSVDAGAYESY